MDERDGVEWSDQQFQYRQTLVKKNKSEIKQEKKMSKTESRFKSKLESLKKFQHSASANSAVEKARAFFRSLELKHLGGSSSNENSSSSRRRLAATTITTDHHNIDISSPTKLPLPSSISPSSSSSVIDDTHNTLSQTTTNDSSFYSKNPSDGIATARLIRIINPNCSNPKETIVQRVMNNEQDDHHLAASYFNFQQVLSEKKSPLSKSYYNERSQSYSMSMEKHREIPTKYDSRPLSPVSALSPNIIYSNRTYPNSPSSLHSALPNGNISNHQMSTSLYNYRPLVCRHIETPSLMSSSFHEESDRISDRIIRPLPSSASSSSMSVWTQSVRRLNSEYTSTINALQQAKESLREAYPEPTDKITKYASLVARGINNLSNGETKKPLGVTFCLTASTSPNSPSSSLSQSTLKHTIQQSKTLPSNMFCKPKLVRPLDLDTFVPPVPKLEPVPTIIEKNEKTASIATIIKKFNNLNHPSSTLKSSIHDENNLDSSFIQINEEQQEILPKTLIFDSIQDKKDQSNTSSMTSITDINTTCSNHSPRVHFGTSVTTYEIEDIPYESPPPPLTSSSSSISDDSTASSTTSTDENQVYESTTQLENNQEETTYTVETFYKSPLNNKNISSSSPTNQQVVIIRENATEEQFNLAREKKCRDNNLTNQNSSEQTFTVNENQVTPLTTPLLTYLNLSVKATASTPVVIEKQENYHSVEPSAHITKDFISHTYHDEDEETIKDVVTANPHTYSPPSRRLISSSSSSSTASSASTVLLTNINATTLPIVSSVTKKTTSTNSNLTKNNNKTVSQLPKRTTTTTTPATTNTSRLKQPSKIVSPSSKLKPPSSTNSKPIKSMLTNSIPSAATTTTMPTSSSSSSMRKPTGIMNQSSPMTNTIVNKATQQQLSSPSSSTLINGKKANLVNGTNMSDSVNPTDASCSVSKNRVRSMVNQFNAAVSSTRPTIPSAISTKRTPPVASTVNSGRLGSTESTNKMTITSPTRSSLQRAMTINNNSPSASSASPSSSSPAINNNIASTYKRKAPLVRSMSNVKEGLLRWCQVQVADYPNVSITNLSSSWSDGLAFCALTHHFFPDAFDFNSLSSNNRKENFELAFRIAEERAGVPRLLDVSDMLIMGNTPDYKCIFTYLNSFLAKVKDLHPTANGIEHH